jgi:hypothetical protein
MSSIVQGLRKSVSGMLRARARVCVCVCVCVCVRVYAYGCVCIYMYVCKRACYIFMMVHTGHLETRTRISDVDDELEKAASQVLCVSSGCR